MKYIPVQLVLLSFLLLDIQTYSQDCSTTWLSTTPPNHWLYFPITFAANQFAYAVGGELYNNNYEYTPVHDDGTLGNWSTITVPQLGNNNNFLGFQELGGCFQGNYLYVLGGRTRDNSGGFTFYNSVFKSNVTSGPLGTFTQQQGLQTPRAACAVVYSSGYLYAISGVKKGDPGCNCEDQPINTVEFCKVSTDGSLGSWNYTSPLVTISGHKYDAWACNNYLFTLDSAGEIERAGQNSDGSLSAWEIMNSPLPDTGYLILTADHLVYLIGNGTTIYNSNLDPLTGTLGSFTTDPRLIPSGITTDGFISYWPYLYTIGYSNTSSPVVFYTCDTESPKIFDFSSSQDTGRWVYENLPNLTNQPTISWLSSYQNSTGVLKLQFTSPNQGVKLTLFTPQWFSSISSHWYELKARIISDISTTNSLLAAADLFNGAAPNPMIISGHGYYSTSSSRVYLRDFQLSSGGINTLYPQLLFKNNSTSPVTLYLDSVIVNSIPPPGD